MLEALLALERYDELELIVHRQLIANATSAQMLVYRAQIEWSRDQREAARAALDRALELWADGDPEYAPIIEARRLRDEYAAD